jgi:hypothetical protein
VCAGTAGEQFGKSPHFGLGSGHIVLGTVRTSKSRAMGGSAQRHVGQKSHGKQGLRELSRWWEGCKNRQVWDVVVGWRWISCCDCGPGLRRDAAGPRVAQMGG